MTSVNQTKIASKDISDVEDEESDLDFDMESAFDLSVKVNKVGSNNEEIDERDCRAITKGFEDV